VVEEREGSEVRLNLTSNTNQRMIEIFEGPEGWRREEVHGTGIPKNYSCRERELPWKTCA